MSPSLVPCDHGSSGSLVWPSSCPAWPQISGVAPSLVLSGRRSLVWPSALSCLATDLWCGPQPCPVWPQISGVALSLVPSGHRFLVWPSALSCLAIDSSGSLVWPRQRLSGPGLRPQALGTLAPRHHFKWTFFLSTLCCPMDNLGRFSPRKASCNRVALPQP